MEARDLVDGDLTVMTDSLEVSSGLRQDCILAPLLFILLYADDIGHCIRTPDALKNVSTALNEACNGCRLIINNEETEVMHFHNVDKPPITIDGHQLAQTHSFTYLDEELTDDTPIDAEIMRRISRGAAAFHSLSTRCWNRKGLSTATKVTVYKALILPCLLYGSETWCTLAQHIHLLESFHRSSLRQIMKISWWQYYMFYFVFK